MPSDLPSSSICSRVRFTEWFCGSPTDGSRHPFSVYANSTLGPASRSISSKASRSTAKSWPPRLRNRSCSSASSHKSSSRIMSFGYLLVRGSQSRSTAGLDP